MADVDVAMDAVDEPVLASDDCYTWAKVADLALRHMARVQVPPTRPQDQSLLTGSIAHDGAYHVQSSGRSLISCDAHIPLSVRVPQTWSIVNYDIERIGAPLVRRPSDFFVGGSNAWNCPLQDCAYTIQLDDLTHDEDEIVAGATEGSPDPFTTADNGRVVATPAFVREVIDLLALAHYESEHLRVAGMRHFIHGQGLNGRILFHWETKNMGEYLTRASVRGWEARSFEEHCRIQVQRAIAQDARTWADGLTRMANQEAKDARERMRIADGRYIRQHYGHLVDMGRVDGLFDARTSLFEGRPPASTAVRGRILAMKAVHLRGFDGYRTKEENAARLERLRAVAEAEKAFWSTGEGSQRLLRRANDPRLYA